VAVALLGTTAGCGFADDNYQAAQKELDNSKTELTVPGSTSTVKPFEVLPASPASSIPVRRATPAEVAAGQVGAGPAPTSPGPAGSSGSGTPKPGSVSPAGGTSQAGATPGGTTQAGATPGGTTQAGATQGGTYPATITTTTTTTVPLSSFCLAARKLQEAGTLVVMGSRSTPAQYRTAIAGVGGALRRLAAGFPANRRPVAQGVATAYAGLEASVKNLTTTTEMIRAAQGFMASNGKQVTSVMRISGELCPVIIDGGYDQAETLQLGA